MAGANEEGAVEVEKMASRGLVKETNVEAEGRRRHPAMAHFSLRWRRTRRIQCVCTMNA